MTRGFIFLFLLCDFVALRSKPPIVLHLLRLRRELSGLKLELKINKKFSKLSTIYLKINSFKYLCSINLGASQVRSFSSSTRLLNAPSEHKGELKLDPNFVTGLVESEGSFSIVKHRDTRANFGMTVSLRFKITMLVNETVLIKKVHTFFGVGSFYIDEKYGTIDYIVRDKISLKVIKDHFIKYPLRGSKHLDFVDFMRALELMEQNLHRSKEGLELLVSLSEGMNSDRKSVV